MKWSLLHREESCCDLEFKSFVLSSRTLFFILKLELLALFHLVANWGSWSWEVLVNLNFESHFAVWWRIVPWYWVLSTGIWEVLISKKVLVHGMMTLIHVVCFLLNFEFHMLVQWKLWACTRVVVDATWTSFSYLVILLTMKSRVESEGSGGNRVQKLG